ncbi:hypothetical protein AX16_002753 [Volvariella volvacea WC 439]|nr:hypothetical protein AX16_002753 [Volvariella volvacea WC 439]
MLGPLLIFFLARTLAPPVPTHISNDPNTLSPIFARVTGCLRDPTKIRSIWDLLYNCLGTIAVCTYIAIHPNIPCRNLSSGRKLWRKMKTTAFALFAPELVIMWAMRQRLAACKIAKQYRECEWTKIHGFFVQMGGLVYYDGKKYRVLTVDGTSTGEIYLSGEKETEMKDIRMPLISEEEIQDKAKGDFLSKLVVVMQTSWFIFQCFACYTQGLVVTELELVTLAFATINIITYILWWNKPLSAAYPIYFNKNGERVPGPLGKNRLRPKPWLSEQYWGISFTWPWEWGHSESAEQRQPSLKDDIARRRSFVVVVWKRLLTQPIMHIIHSTLELMDESCPSGASVGSYYSGRLSLEDWVVLGYFSSFIEALFGGIHLIAWNYSVPTTAEKILWRTSSMVITAVPIFFAFRYSLILIKREYEPEGWTGTVLNWITIVNDWIAVFGGICYALARAALFVEAFIALRDLPPSAYENIAWSAFIPHI